MAKDNLSIPKIKKLNLEEIKSSSISFLLDLVQEQKLEIKRLQIAGERRMRVYGSLDAMEILGVGDKLLKWYRDNGYLSYSHVKDKFWYTEEDIKEFLKKNKFKAFAYDNEF